MRQEIFGSVHSNIRGKNLNRGEEEKKEAQKGCKKLPAKNDQGNDPVWVSYWLDLAGSHWKEPGTEPIPALWGPSMEKVPEKASDRSLQMNPGIIA